MHKKYKTGLMIFTFIVLTGQFLVRGYVASAHELSSLENIVDTGYEDDVRTVLNDWDYTEQENSIILTRYIGMSTDIIIPGSIDGKQVFLQNSGNSTGLDRFPENTTSIVVGNADQKVKVTDGNAARLFSELTNLTYLDASGLDTSDITTMYRMFYNCRNLITLDVSGWDTGCVTNMDYMFQTCNSLTGLDVSGWDTGNVTSMYSMFRGCSSLTGLDVSGWNMGRVTNISCMFYSCASLTELDLSDWDTSNITGSNMDAMFYDCSGLNTLNVSGWNISSVTSTQNMFFNCSSLTRLDLSSWDTGNVTSMNYMFYYCSSLAELDISGWDTGKVEAILYMFNNCSNLQVLDLTGHDYSSVIPGWTVGVFDLVDASAMLPTLIISNDPLIQNICDGPIAGRVPAGPTYHFGEGIFTDENGNARSEMKYFDTLLVTDVNDFTVYSIANKYIPDKDGAVFSGWYLDEAYSQPFEKAGDTMELPDLISANLYAKYVNEYTVTFVDYDGSIIKETIVLEGGSAIAPEENPTREGYTFTGWDKDFENITEDMVIKALYEEKKGLQENMDKGDENPGNGNLGNDSQESENPGNSNQENENPENEEYRNDNQENEEINTPDVIVSPPEISTAENMQMDNSDSTTAKVLADSPKTGDTVAIEFYILLLFSSFVAFIILKLKNIKE